MKVGKNKPAREERFSLSFSKEDYEKSLTKQAFKDECDINKIVKRFTKMPVDDVSKMLGTPFQGYYDDFSDVGDLRTVYERIAQAEESFLGLPAKVRADFQNDPVAFLEFSQNPENEKKMREYGLLKESTPVATNDSPESAQEA